MRRVDDLTYYLRVPSVMKSGSLNLLDPSRPHNGGYFTFFFVFTNGSVSFHFLIHKAVTLFSRLVSVDFGKCSYKCSCYNFTPIPLYRVILSILEELLEMFATTVQAELNATLDVCESGVQDVLTNRSNFT